MIKFYLISLKKINFLFKYYLFSLKIKKYFRVKKNLYKNKVFMFENLIFVYIKDNQIFCRLPFISLDKDFLMSELIIQIIFCSYMIIWATLVLFSLFNIFIKLFKLEVIVDSFLNKLQNYLNQEIGEINTFFLILSIVFSLFFLDIIYFVLDCLDIVYNSFIGWVLILFVSVIVILPISIIYDYRAFFISFIRGSSTNSSFLFELVLDYLHLVSFFLRINIQLIRILILTVFFAMYNELYIEYIYDLYNSNYTNPTNFSEFTVYYFIKLFSTFFYMMYEISHFWLLFFIQSTAFSLILVILIQFLYIVYLIYKVEEYFRLKKNKKK